MLVKGSRVVDAAARAVKRERYQCRDRRPPCRLTHSTCVNVVWFGLRKRRMPLTCILTAETRSKMR